jgi:hypothetical protein
MKQPSNHSNEANQLRWGVVVAVCAAAGVVIFIATSVSQRWWTKEPPVAESKPRIEIAKAKPHPLPSRPPIVDNSPPPAPVSLPRTNRPPVQRPPEPVAPPVIEPAPVQNVPVPISNEYVGGGTPPMSIVRGQVFLKGTPPPEKTIEMDAVCGKLQAQPRTTRHFVVGTNGGLANVFVYVKEGLSGQVFERSAPALVLDQVDCMYEPYVFGLMTRQPFKIRNSDSFLHNVHATPKINTEFNLGQQSKKVNGLKGFQKPELFLRIKCDVHNWMFAYACVVEHPIFAVTDTNGFFQLPGSLPWGQYTLAAVHQKSGEQVQPLTITNQPSTDLSFEFVIPPQ